jgi:ribosomal protein S12 methylthiotransferase accessory factor
MSYAGLFNFSACDPGPLIRALEARNVTLGDARVPNIVIAVDYVLPKLAAINDAALRESRPWILIKPMGPEYWVGPLFRPDRTACWNCLRRRLVENRWSDHEFWRMGLPTPIRGRELSENELSTLCRFVADQVAAFVTTGSSVLQDTILSFEGQRRRSHFVQRLEECGLCLTAETHSSQGSDGVMFLSRLSRHYSPITGFLSQLKDTAGDAWLPVHLVRANCAIAIDERNPLAGSPPICCVGRGLNPEQAITSCLAEGAERYSIFARGTEKVLRASYKDVSGQAIHPGNLLVHELFDESAVIDWAELQSVKHGIRFFPAALCYLGGGPDELRAVADSNGCAAGRSEVEAMENAVLELIERDAASVWWHNRSARPGLAWDSFDDQFLESVPELFGRFGLDVWLLDLTTDWLVPVCAAVCCDCQGRRITYAFAAGRTWTAAALSATTELIQTWIALARSPDSEFGPALDWRKTDRLEERANRFLRPTGMVRRTMHGAVSLEHLMLRARELGFDVLSANLTRPEVGIPVVRAVIPGLVPRRFTPRLARLFELPLQLGWQNSTIAPSGLNQRPLL